MNQAMTAVIKKDFKGITSNRRLFASLLIVPLALMIILPSIFIFMIHFIPDDPDVQKLLDLIPRLDPSVSIELTVAGLIVNYILPVFFLIIPITRSRVSIMAASSFVGEKEKHTLETLLYSPLSAGQIFRAKVMASFLLSMTVSMISFLAMFAVVETEVFFLMGSLLLPDINWLIVLLLLSPSVSLIAITLIVRGSAKAQSVEESQQSAVFLIIPVLLLIVGQFSGVMLLNVWILLGLSILCAAAAWLLMQRALGKFTYEMLLR